VTRGLSDLGDRRRAATDFDTNLVVVAAAGTGKTSLLVERFLNLILSGRTRPRDTVALTFTEKAAAEMKSRVASALEDVLQATGGGAEPDPSMEAGRSLAWLRGEVGLDDAELHRRALGALNGIDHAFLGTIHSWCADLLRRHPREADLSPDFTVDEGVLQDLLLESEWTRFLTRELGPEATRAPLWERVLTAFSQEDLDRVGAALARNPAACLLLDREGYRPLDELRAFREEIEARKRELGERRTAVRPGLKLHGTMGFLIELCSAFLEGGCPALRAAAERDPEFFRGSLSPNAGKGTPDRESIEAAANAAFGLLRDLIKVDDRAFPDLMEALRPFAHDYRRALYEEGILGFDDLLLLARDLLRDDAGVRAREAARIRALLVDEFQDTDPLQYEIVFLLSGRGEGKIPDPYAVPLEPGRLFIVGDPQQSIYRFRGADMVAYRRARAHVLEAGEELRLVANFRSPTDVLDPLNDLFRGWIGTDRVLEPDFVELESGVEGTGRVELWTVETAPSASAEDRRRAEARVLAAELAEWPRERYSRVAILFRALTDIPIYVRALREAGIPYVVDGGRAFAERPEVVEALCLLRALANPADQVAVAGVLRSSFGGVEDQEMADFAVGTGRFSWDRPIPPEEAAVFPRPTSVLSRLRELDRLRRVLPLDRWIHRVLTEGDFLLVQASFLDGSQRVANVRKLAERAAGLARNQGLSLEPALDILQAEFTGDRVEGESPLADEGVDAVRLMSIHKAKGLQFDVVFLPDLVRKGPPEDWSTQVDRTFLGGEAWLAVRIERGPMNSAFAVGKQENSRHEAAERKRLFYVATTRARTRLVLLNSAEKASKADVWLEALIRGWGYSPDGPEGAIGEGRVRHLRRVPGDGAHAESEAPPDMTGPYRAFLEATERAAAVRPPRFRRPSADHRAIRLESRNDDEEETGSGASPRERNLPRAAGSAVHRLLEQADFRRPENLRERVGRVAEEEAADLGLDPARVEAETIAILDGFLASSLPGRLASVEILGREVPILFRDEAGATVSGYADLVYRHEGRVHVADYKTDELTGPLAAETYRGQLADYGTAVRSALGLDSPPVLEVLFVRDGTRVEL